MSSGIPEPQARPESSALRGGGALALSKGGRQILRLLVTVALARLLSPEEFGVVAIAMGVLSLGLILETAGLSAAVVQREQVSHRALGTLFWLNAGLGALLTGIVWAAAPLLAELLAQPELRDVLRVAVWTLLLNAIAVQPRALLQRNMRFVTTAKIEVLSALAGGLVGLLMAWRGLSYWALVGQILVSDVLVVTMLFWSVRLPLSRPALTPEVREMVRFGASMLGFNLVLTAATNLHVVLLGRVAGASGAGLYSRGFALASLPQALLQTSAAHVALPKLSMRQSDPAAYSSFYYQGVQLLSLMTLPVAMLMLACGDLIAVVVYGGQWTEVGPLLRIFALGLAATPLLHSTGQIFVSRGEPQRMFRWGVFGSSVRIASTLLGLPFGVTGVAWGWSIGTILLLLPGLLYAYRNSPISLSGTLRAVRGNYIAAALAGPVCWGGASVLEGMPALVRLALGAGLGGFAYLGLAYFAFGQGPLMRRAAQAMRNR